MNCPACGSQEAQRQVAPLWDRPQTIYYCPACNRCYGVPDGQRDTPQLSDAETTLLGLIVAGRPNKQIATAVGVSLRTVAMRRRALQAKLGARSSADLIRKAIELGL